MEKSDMYVLGVDPGTFPFFNTILKILFGFLKLPARRDFPGFSS